MKYTNNIPIETETIERIKNNFVKNFYPISKWILFCEELIKLGLQGYVYQSKTTKSKYVYIKKNKKTYYKVRFSDHKAPLHKELYNDCDLFIGYRRTGKAINTQEAIEIIKKEFNL